MNSEERSAPHPFVLCTQAHLTTWAPIGPHCECGEPESHPIHQTEKKEAA